MFLTCILLCFYFPLSLCAQPNPPEGVGSKLKKIDQIQEGLEIIDHFIKHPFDLVDIRNWKLYRKLDVIKAGIDEIKGKIDVMINSHLKAALSALENAKLIENQDEKLDSIRSAKHFLTQAINIEETLERKVFATYLLGTVFLMLDETKVAQHHLQKVLDTPFEVGGIVTSSTIHSPTIHRLKTDATAILCGLNQQTREVNRFCSYHILYQEGNAGTIDWIEGCIQTQDQVKCDQAASSALGHYIRKNQQENAKSSLDLIDSLDQLKDKEIKYLTPILKNECLEPNHQKNTSST
jgi:hypothetical protein